MASSVMKGLVTNDSIGIKNGIERLRKESQNRPLSGSYGEVILVVLNAL